MFLAIKVGSVTNAQRGAKLLRSRGYKPVISRMESPQPDDGCGYVLKLSTYEKEEVIRLLRTNGISVLGVEDL